MAKVHEVLVKVRGGKNGAGAQSLSATPGIRAEPILEVPARPADAAFGLAKKGSATWLRVTAEPASDNPWDNAHALLERQQGLGVAGGLGPIEAIEPDLEQQWPHGDSPGNESALALAAAKPQCTFDDQNAEGGRPKGPSVGWNLLDGFSALAQARARVGDKQAQIIIAHLDTGFDKAHATVPVNLMHALQRNFVAGDPPNDATDRTPDGLGFIRNRGHGTGTLSLLAGAQMANPSDPWKTFAAAIGGAPLARILPVRIADWVVRFRLGTMVQGIDYARTHGAHVLSMSMGGVSSRALVDAVNLAYDAGLLMVTAAGNNFAGTPTPRTVVFPARLHRVLAACGVMADGRAYTGLANRTMQGNFGPDEKMETALGAYTPNVPWAQIDCANLVDMDGAGTSAATPQIAAAAALWLAEHWDEVKKYPEPWMRVEAARHALFASARKSTAKMDLARTRKTIGNGVCNALAALDILPLPAAQLTKRPPAKASFSVANLLFGGGGVSLDAVSTAQKEMLALELTQIAQRVVEVDEAIDDPDRPPQTIPAAACSRYLEAALDHGQPSRLLRAFLERLVGRNRPSIPAAAPKSSGLARRPKPAVPPRRRLRVYALDPSLGKQIQSRQLNETVLTVPWDDMPTHEKDGPLTERRSRMEALQPGPVGEYLEVIDVDPASGKVYEPVDLNDPYLLAQDGLAPSEGNPQFHQQMVYAVAMTTIGHFERALGRSALWAPTGNNETRRLRIYPHGLRDENAYYSPQKKALLFGYFQSRSSGVDATAPGTMVFTCLSSDIIAHEMTHALLDGLHRRFEEPSNPDVIAFHEAFADIVALFQHFMITDLVRFEIGHAHGNLTAAKLLSGIAKQFGEGANRHGPLRDYVGAEVSNLVYADTKEPHARGSILVHAVYDAFLNVVSYRTADLIRIATNGTGVLAAGALHPDLVNRLTTETCETASYFLTMCIRALDYCPPVDITFGEYLRAIITADRDLVVEDRHGYRVAIMESFRKRGILPADVRTVSEETLSWGTFHDPTPVWLDRLVDAVDINFNRVLTRHEIFNLNRENCGNVSRKLSEIFAEDAERLREFGLMPGIRRYDELGKEVAVADGSTYQLCNTTFEVHNIRPARRIAPDGSHRTEIIAVITQRRPIPFDGKDVANGFFWFRGGATLVIDPRDNVREIRYSVLKNCASEDRLQRQRESMGASYLSPLRALYFGGDCRKSVAEPFALIHADREAHHG
ncbi:S8 family serine peptidase [Tahibacter amnicola]|uniref:S8 family serine peptidase n=1 Tax=Tahibacter amnicola TaxID=2976241 RepID=A0ABY6BLD2_9GAMM|nr:S8 family serine peptidase [Tahibacter amnicola]UXI70243.1 S8 family serine peptidase [Tahibacter amnicola]